MGEWVNVSGGPGGGVECKPMSEVFGVGSGFGAYDFCRVWGSESGKRAAGGHEGQDGQGAEGTHEGHE